MEVHEHFGVIDWVVVAAYIVLTTWIGHRLKGRQATIRDFFLAGRSLPWPAVCGSIIATEISAITFVGVPGMVFAMGGDFTYLQWALGSVLARFIVGIWFVRAFYRQEIYSPYDFIALKMGEGMKQLTTALFSLGTVLGQSVRLLVTALILRTVTGLDFAVCIWIIGGVAVVWTWMGGMTTVIWTDVIQFVIFLVSAVVALVLLVGSLAGGWEGFWTTAEEAGKLRLLNLTTDPAVQFTLWVGLLAMPFQNLAAFGTDQLNAQRMFCCRNAKDASKAIIFSSFSQVITVLMLFVGAALYVYYRQHPPGEAEARLFAEDSDYVFPVWITTFLPTGVSGLVLAGAFAAAISSMDSALAALAQTSLSVFHKGGNLEDGDQKKMVFHSRLIVLAWGVALPLCALGLQAIRGELNLVSLAFGMVSYTYGPLLGILFLALAGIRGAGPGAAVGAVLSALLTLAVRPDLYMILANLKLLTVQQAKELVPPVSFVWLYPVTCGLTFGCGWLWAKLRNPEKKTAH